MAATTKVEVTEPQHRLLTTEEKYPAFVGGFGSGKTAGLILRALTLKSQYWGLNYAYYLPTYDLVEQIAWPRFLEILEEWRWPHEPNRQKKTITFPSGGKIIFRTMDRPERIVGYEVADSAVDELDTLKLEDARHVWQKIIARNRQKKPDGGVNTVAVGTTPEGFRFVYERWAKKGGEGYQLIKAPTWTNEHNLPADYIPTLKASYPPQLLAAYLDAEFVNMTAGSVYPEFDRELNGTDAVEEAGEALHVGMDFNVGKMAAIVHVIRRDEPYAVNEITGARDTPQMIDLLKRDYAGRKVIVYPDASGDSRKSVNASESDISLLRDAGFQVRANPRNPRVKDRVLAVNAQILAGDKRRYHVNTDRCPDLTEALEQQAWDKNGEPDKSGDLDHPVDAAGYFIVYRWPLRKQGLKKRKLKGV